MGQTSTSDKAGAATPLTPGVTASGDISLWIDWLNKLAEANGTDVIGAALIGAAALQRGGNTKDWKPGGRLRKALDRILVKEAK